jgi:hypothetical protein
MDWDKPVKVIHGSKEVWLACQECGGYLSGGRTIYKDFLPYCSSECASHHKPLPKMVCEEVKSGQ